MVTTLIRLCGCARCFESHMLATFLLDVAQITSHFTCSLLILVLLSHTGRTTRPYLTIFPEWRGLQDGPLSRYFVSTMEHRSYTEDISSCTQAFNFGSLPMMLMAHVRTQKNVLNRRGSNLGHLVPETSALICSLSRFLYPATQ